MGVRRGEDNILPEGKANAIQKQKDSITHKDSPKPQEKQKKDLSLNHIISQLI